MLQCLLPDVEEEDIIALIQGIFSRYDTDSDGRLTFWEFSQHGRGPIHRLCVFVRDVFEGINAGASGDASVAPSSGSSTGDAADAVSETEKPQYQRSSSASSVASRGLTFPTSSLVNSSSEDKTANTASDELISQVTSGTDNLRSSLRSISPPARAVPNSTDKTSTNKQRRVHIATARSDSPFRFDPNSDGYYGRWRLVNPAECKGLTYRRRSGTRGISLVMGESVHTGSDVVLCLLFDRFYWTELNAGAWWASNKHRFVRTWHSAQWDERGVEGNKRLSSGYAWIAQHAGSTVAEAESHSNTLAAQVALPSAVVDAGHRAQKEAENAQSTRAKFLQAGEGQGQDSLRAALGLPQRKERSKAQNRSMSAPKSARFEVPPVPLVKRKETPVNIAFGKVIHAPVPGPQKSTRSTQPRFSVASQDLSGSSQISHKDPIILSNSSRSLASAGSAHQKTDFLTRATDYSPS